MDLELHNASGHSWGRNQQGEAQNGSQPLSTHQEILSPGRFHDALGKHSL